ncbi:hypothetical protein Ct61P_10279 [Colletotrichum tofieldiae]|nr:hypothetical protein Ct61P_10279 [Colletotrichum tofieldiae]
MLDTVRGTLYLEIASPWTPQIVVLFQAHAFLVVRFLVQQLTARLSFFVAIFMVFLLIVDVRLQRHDTYLEEPDMLV